jgi:signal transduction histidine kinase
MSANAHSFPKLPRGPDVLGELLHSLSQPLTSLRCSLELSLGHSLEPSRELSIEEVAEQQQESVAAALQQTEKVIGMIQLMREYLDAEQPGLSACSTALAPVMRSVVEELASIAAVRGIQLRLVGTCTATLAVPEGRLRLALQYLIAAMIEAQPEGGKVMLLLGESPAGTVLRMEGERSVRELPTRPNPAGATSASASVLTLRRVRLAIASRVLETAGASLLFGEGDVNSTEFVLRIPRRVGASAR